MSDKQIEAVRIGDSNPSPDLKGTPLRSIFCLKNRDEIKKFEEEEDCFILEFDPYDVLDMSKASLTDDIDHAEADLRITAEKGQGTPLRSIFCLKNRDESKKHEAVEDCFILEFDPYDDLNMLKASLSDDFDNDEADLCITAEKGKVACRDYPHPRHTCAKYPFEKTPHDRHCKLLHRVQSGPVSLVIAMPLTMKLGTIKRN
ncbi:hypothetical protein BUALT_Bualt06G0139000 [Buddleja alternifolia]|uniref:Uncharacterized protein n=1 Tax=Buddleja alternifolia TaxID=168488 RepID=A0AAV6XF63_9LAMI|nr:hypothetical protein BUALT_Bualt06G0139000 [Buddleja alternifolia]